jgi:hypothetical protein
MSIITLDGQSLLCLSDNFSISLKMTQVGPKMILVFSWDLKTQLADFLGSEDKIHSNKLP